MAYADKYIESILKSYITDEAKTLANKMQATGTSIVKLGTISRTMNSIGSVSLHDDMYMCIAKESLIFELNDRIYKEEEHGYCVILATSGSSELSRRYGGMLIAKINIENEKTQFMQSRYASAKVMSDIIKTLTKTEAEVKLTNIKIEKLEIDKLCKLYRGV